MDRRMIFFIAIFIGIFFVLSSQGKQKAGWKGTIDAKDGIMVIKEPCGADV